MKRIIIWLIKGYQKTGFFHGQLFKTIFLTDSVCRFVPSCSEYAIESVERFGAIKGGGYAIKRILHCHPFSKGGVDPVPKK